MLVLSVALTPSLPAAGSAATKPAAAIPRSASAKRLNLISLERTPLEPPWFRRLRRHRLGLAERLDHDVASPLVDHALGPVDLVAGCEQEAAVVLSDGLVLLTCDVEGLGTAFAAALADEQLHAAIHERARQLGDPIVDFPEDGLATGPADQEESPILTASLPAQTSSSISGGVVREAVTWAASSWTRRRFDRAARRSSSKAWASSSPSRSASTPFACSITTRDASA